MNLLLKTRGKNSARNKSQLYAGQVLFRETVVEVTGSWIKSICLLMFPLPTNTLSWRQSELSPRWQLIGCRLRRLNRLIGKMWGFLSGSLWKLHLHFFVHPRQLLLTIPASKSTKRFRRGERSGRIQIVFARHFSPLTSHADRIVIIIKMLQAQRSQ